MKRSLIAVGLLLSGAGTAWTQPPSYTIQDLGTLGGSTAPADLNDAGWVVGSSQVDTFDSHAFLWLPAPALGLPAGIHDLGTLGTGERSSASAIDAAGRIVGWSQITDGEIEVHGFSWQAGMMTDLGTSERWPSSQAQGTNDRGDVAGTVSAFGCRPVLWLPEARYGLPAGVNEMPLPAGWDEGSAGDVNDLGQTVGYVCSPRPAPCSMSLRWASPARCCWRCSWRDAVRRSSRGAGRSREPSEVHE